MELFLRKWYQQNVSRPLKVSLNTVLVLVSWEFCYLGRCLTLLFCVASITSQPLPCYFLNYLWPYGWKLQHRLVTDATLSSRSNMGAPSLCSPPSSAPTLTHYLPTVHLHYHYYYNYYCHHLSPHLALPHHRSTLQYRPENSLKRLGGLFTAHSRFLFIFLWPLAVTSISTFSFYLSFSSFILLYFHYALFLLPFSLFTCHLLSRLCVSWWSSSWWYRGPRTRLLLRRVKRGKNKK